MITITGLNTYPIKSCAGTALDEAPLTPRGLHHDRDFMLIDDDCRFVSQRQVPEMALIRPTIGIGSLMVTAPGMSALEIPLACEPDDTRRVGATVHGKPVIGQLIGCEHDEWFSSFLPAPKGGAGHYRLLRVVESSPRQVGERYRRDGATNQLGFADGHPLLLATEPSLAALNSEMETPVPMNRFRPNIVVDGPELVAYDEDHWTRVQLGELTAFVVKACDRCAIPDVNQRTAVTGKAVRRALVARRGVNAHDESNKGVFFAQNLNHVYAPGSILRLGDPVEVLARVPTPNVIITRASRAQAPAYG